MWAITICKIRALLAEKIRNVIDPGNFMYQLLSFYYKINNQ